MPMNMEVKIFYEDENLIVIDKPAGLVVHPGAGEHGQTLMDWFLKKYPAAQKLNWPDPTRPGIVHRLDKETSGLMVLANNPESLKKLQDLFQSHKIQKSYLALVYGKFEKPLGEIKSLIGRDPNARRQQVSRSIFFDFEPGPKGAPFGGKKREAKTDYKVLKEYQYGKEILSLIEANLETGRTHQIRVQFKSLGHPVIGDQIYNIKHSRKISRELGLHRQFLHAYKLSFDRYDFELKLPSELDNILNSLKK